jgi:protein-S-isoprenylcysteine O-methyltransferase Ste14
LVVRPGISSGAWRVDHPLVDLVLLPHDAREQHRGSVVKLQQERGQTVISTGPYAFVRHPMYFGAALYFIGTALLLGSWWGVLFAFILIGLLCIRIPIEEKALRAGLKGYDEYATRVRYRLIPHIW